MNSIQKSLTKLSFKSVDADNTSRLTTTDAHAEQSESNTSSKENISDVHQYERQSSVNRLDEGLESTHFDEDIDEDKLGTESDGKNKRFH